MVPLIKIIREVTVKDLLDEFTWLQPSLNATNPAAICISAVAEIGEAGSGILSFATHARAPESSRGAIIIGYSGAQFVGNHLLASANPRLDFIRVLRWLSNSEVLALEQPSYVDDSACVHSSAIIESGVVIGAGTRIGPGVVVRSGVRIGMDCVLESNVVIGDKGFGYERDESGRPLEFIHLGGVIIGDRVALGTGTVVASGTLSPTLIADDVKTDNLVHIAHNCKIREGVMIAAAAEVSGSVEIGSRSWIGPNSSIMDGISIGEQALVGLGAVVTKNVADRSVVAGNPARFLRLVDF